MDLNWIAERYALDVDHIKITRLVRGADQNYALWVINADKINKLLEDLIASSSQVFWSTFSFANNLKKLLESCLDFYIKVGYFNEIDYYTSIDRSISSLFLSIYQRLQLVFLRVFVNLRSDNISNTSHADLIYTKKIVTIEILIKFSNVYGVANKDILIAVYRKLFQVQPSYYRDLELFIESTVKFFEGSDELIKNLVCSMENGRVERDEMHTKNLVKILDNSSNVFLSLALFVQVFRPKNLWMNLINYIPKFVDNVSKYLTDLNLLNFAASSTIISINLLANKRARIFQAGVYLFKVFYTLDTINDRDRFDMLYNCVIHKEFLVRLDDLIKLQMEFLQFEKQRYCNREHVKTVIKLIEDAYAEKAKNIKTSLNQKQILSNIGRAVDQQLKDTIESLSDLLPTHSKEQLHLCLRHFGYDVERTTNALMETDELPFELRVLLRTKDNFNDVRPTGIAIPQFSDTIPLEQCDNLAEYSGVLPPAPNRPRSIFDFKAEGGSSTESCASLNGLKQREKVGDRLAKMLTKYEGLFDTAQLHVVQDSIERVQQNPGNGGHFSSRAKEVVVDGKPMIISDPVRRLNEDVSEADKSAIRKTYTNYKYELSDEDDEGGRYNLEEKFEAEVGISGRFNRPKIINETSFSTTKNNNKEDTSEDEYEDREDLIKSRNLPESSSDDNATIAPNPNNPATAAAAEGKESKSSKKRQQLMENASKADWSRKPRPQAQAGASNKPTAANKTTSNNNNKKTGASASNDDAKKHNSAKYRQYKTKQKQGGADRKQRGGML